MDPLTIGKYRIDGILGQGAMGIVYRGFDESVGRAVAIKTIRKEVAGSRSWDAVARFRSEARAAGRLSHPNIVTVYDFAEDEDSAHLVCEYVPGRGLDVWLGEHRRADPATALMWMGQLLDALACAHAHGVVHRDVKASNILIVGNRLLKLADFGIAHVDSAHRTQVGLMIGTPSCMAPEQIRGGRIDGRTDVFAAGVLLYQMLSGATPFSGTDEAIMYKIVYEPHQPLSQVTNDPTLRAFDAVLEQGFVGLGRGVAECLFVLEIEFERTHTDVRSRRFDFERKRHAFVGLNPDHQYIGSHVLNSAGLEQ